MGVTHCKDKPIVEFFDDEEAALQRQLEALLPHAYSARITSRSREGSSLTVRNLGPRDPGSHYLLHNGKLQLIGSGRPYFEAENLADVKYIQYPARDGVTIPAFLTVPSGNPPFPLVVLPHGGPFVREVIIFDEWAQLLANNGYMVLQPQYRGGSPLSMENVNTKAFIQSLKSNIKTSAILQETLNAKETDKDSGTMLDESQLLDD